MKLQGLFNVLSSNSSLHFLFRLFLGTDSNSASSPVRETPRSPPTGSSGESMDSVSVSSSDSGSPSDSEGLATPTHTSDSQQNKVGDKATGRKCCALKKVHNFIKYESIPFKFFYWINIFTRIKLHMRINKCSNFWAFTGHFIKYAFSFRTGAVLHGTDSTRCWKHYSDFVPRWYERAVHHTAAASVTLPFPRALILTLYEL